LVLRRASRREFHIVLPANLEGGASRCAGPEGAKWNATQGLLDPHAAAGSLIMRTKAGRTYFSVNDRAGDAFQDNEGYFEFDVRLP
jgi:hypothetical protein